MLTKPIFSNFFLNAFRVALWLTSFLSGAQAIIQANDSISLNSNLFTNIIVKGVQVKITVLPQTVSNIKYETIEQIPPSQNQEGDKNKAIFLVLPNTQLSGVEYLTGAEVVYAEVPTHKIDESQDPVESNEIARTVSIQQKSILLTKYYKVDNTPPSFSTSKKLSSSTTQPTQLKLFIIAKTYLTRRGPQNPNYLFFLTEFFFNKSLSHTHTVRPPPFV